MKGLLVFPLNFELEELIGLRKKLTSQFKSFKNHVEIDEFHFGNNDVYLNMIRKAGFLKLPKVLFFFNYYAIFFFKILKFTDFNKYDFIYVRYPLTNPFLLYFLRKVKQKNSKIKIVIEIPTYPYSLEGITLKRKFLIWVDKLLNFRLKKYVDLIVTHYGQKEIFGIPAYHMGNGVEIKPFIDLVKGGGKQVINFLCIANVSFYHGLDRLIIGMKRYYENQQDVKIVLKIVGEGPDLASVKHLVKENKLEDYIKFEGVMDGESLENVILESDIGVSTLAWHRCNVKVDGSIKSREYCMYGLPFITCAKDYDFLDDFKFNKILGLNDDPIDIFEIISFFKDIQKIPNYRSEMYYYAKENLSWEMKIKNFLFYIEND